MDQAPPQATGSDEIPAHILKLIMTAHSNSPVLVLFSKYLWTPIQFPMTGGVHHPYIPEGRQVQTNCRSFSFKCIYAPRTSSPLSTTWCQITSMASESDDPGKVSRFSPYRRPNLRCLSRLREGIRQGTTPEASEQREHFSMNSKLS